MSAEPSRNPFCMTGQEILDAVVQLRLNAEAKGYNIDAECSFFHMSRTCRLSLRYYTNPGEPEVKKMWFGAECLDTAQAFVASLYSRTIESVNQTLGIE